MKKHSRLALLSLISLPLIALAFVSVSKMGPTDPNSIAEAPQDGRSIDTVVTDGSALQKKSAQARSTTQDGTDSTDSRTVTASNTPSQKTDPAFVRDESTTPKLVRIDNQLYPLQTYKPTAIPNDPNANQWWVQNTKLPQAWDIPQGDNETTLAVIDTGFGLKHEEFANRWATNAGEQGIATTESASKLNCTDRNLALDASCNLIDDDFDTIVDNESGATTLENPSRLNCTAQSKPLTKSCNLIDDDSNGYVDDVTGWDFTNYDNSVQAGEINPNGTGTTHGTLTAGIAAATGNNGKGIAGVDWKTKILPIQAIDDDEYGDTRTVGRSIYYAVSRNVDVISLSLGGAGSDPYVRQAVQAAIKQGITVVASAGNDGCDCIVYPANYPEVIAVGALNESNQRASFSSYGANLDFIAPGTNLTSPTWSASNGTSGYASNINGTSFSAPLVSGLLTRLLSQSPTMTPQQQYAAVSENLNRLSISTSRSNTLGFGTVDASAVTNRVTAPYFRDIQYAFAQVSMGDYLSSSSPTDEVGTYYTQKCDNNKYGTTKLYKLTKSGTKPFYSASHVEAANAVSSGYVASHFAYLCTQQPQDQTDTLRLLHIEREF